MLEDFKKFALRGNVVDLAIGVVIGAAFGAIVASLVSDIIMPITGGLDFSNYYLPLSSKIQAGVAYADAKKQGAVLGYGQFITLALNFIIIAFVLFLVIKAMTRLQKADAAEDAPVVSPEAKLLAEIRDQMAALNARLPGPAAQPGISAAVARSDG